LPVHHPAMPPPAIWLSVLIPVYNVAPYLAACVQSVAQQADAGVEILLLDDCSGDASWAVMQQLAAQWPLRLLRHARNSGISAARNTLIDAARGRYLWFVDSDDMLLPGAIAALRAIVQQHAPDMVLCDFAVWRERTQAKHRLRSLWRSESHQRSFAGAHSRLCSNATQALLTGMLRTGRLHAWSKISRRALWGQDLRFPQGQFFEDMAAMALLAARCRSFYYCPRPWLAYRQRGDSILATMNEEKALHQASALRFLHQALDGVDTTPALRLAWAWQCARNYMGAMRYLHSRAQHLGAARTAALACAYRRAFTQSSPLSMPQLLRACLRRLWWLRWAKLRRWWPTSK